MAAPKRVTFGAALAALVLGIGGSALLLQIGRHPAPILDPAAHESSPALSNAAPIATAVQPVAPHAAPTPASPPDTASAAAPPTAAASRASQALAPDRTASLGRAAKDESRPSSPPPASPGPDHSERRPAVRAPDQIGDLLRGKPVGDGSGLVRAAQIALAKLGYAVDPHGVENGATRRALRDFQRAHGLAPTTEINSELVKQLTAAAAAQR